MLPLLVHDFLLTVRALPATIFFFNSLYPVTMKSLIADLKYLNSESYYNQFSFCLVSWISWNLFGISAMVELLL